MKIISFKLDLKILNYILLKKKANNNNVLDKTSKNISNNDDSFRKFINEKMTTFKFHLK